MCTKKLNLFRQKVGTCIHILLLKMLCLNGLSRITVEPLVFSAILIISMNNIISQQYIYQRLSVQYGINNSNGSNKQCANLNSSDPISELEKKVSAETSLWVLYLNVAGFIPSLFCTALVGSWGDEVGRRKPIISTFLGMLALICIFMSVIHFQLPIYLLLVGRLVCGFSGDFSALLCCCFAYLADVSSVQSRTIRFAVAEASLGIGGLVASLAAGIWVEAQGLFVPMWLPFSLTIFGVIYTLLILPESVQHDHAHSIIQDFKKLFTCQPFSGIWRMLLAEFRGSGHLFGMLLSFFIMMMLFTGYTDIIIVYELSSPFCWTPNLIGYSSAITSFSFVIALVVFKILNNRISSWWFVFIGVFSMSASFLTFAFAAASWTLFLALCLGSLSTVPSTMIRSMVSRLVGEDEQGSVFALLACSQSTAQLVASLAFNAIYAATVAHFRGTIFLVFTGLAVVLLIIFSAVFQKTKQQLQHKMTMEYSPVEENA